MVDLVPSSSTNVEDGAGSELEHAPSPKANAKVVASKTERGRCFMVGGGANKALTSDKSTNKKAAYMQRRGFNHAACCAAWMFVGLGETARAQGVDTLSAPDALGGLREALAQGARTAVLQLGQPGGFLNHPKVRIGLPGVLQDIAPLLQATGQGKRLDALTLAMNTAAEKAVPQAADLLAQAIRQLSVNDARRILRGGETGATDFFADKTRSALTEQFLPVVRRSTEQVQLADKYQSVAGRAAKLGLMKAEEADLPAYVTARALDGLYQVIGEEERKIRQNPAQAGTALLKKVFGAL